MSRAVRRLKWAILFLSALTVWNVVSSVVFGDHSCLNSGQMVPPS